MRILINLSMIIIRFVVEIQVTLHLRASSKYKCTLYPIKKEEDFVVFLGLSVVNSEYFYIILLPQ